MVPQNELEGMQWLQEQQELYKIWAMRVSLVALLLSTAVLMRSLFCKPRSESSDGGLVDVEAGMPIDCAAVSMMRSCIFFEVTPEDGGRMHDPQYLSLRMCRRFAEAR